MSPRDEALTIGLRTLRSARDTAAYIHQREEDAAMTATPTPTRRPAIPATFAGLDTASADEMPEDYGRWLIHGPQGSGKTSLAATIAGLGPTLFLDLTGEKGIRVIRRSPWQHNITIVRPTSITALDDVYWDLAKGGHPFRAVVLDSETAAQKMAMRFMLGHDETAVREIRQGVAPADQRTWGQTLDIMTDLATFWYGLADADRERPIHVVMTAQTRFNEDEETGGINRVPDVQKGALSIALASPDYVLYTDVEENIEAVADDSQPPVHHVVRFGANPSYRTKARLPYHLRGKIPPVLGRREPVDLVKLSRILGIGGIPEETPRRPVAAPAKKASPPATPPSTSTPTTEKKE